MNLDDFDSLSEIINGLDDRFFWKPIIGDKQSLAEFDQHIDLIEESHNWPKERNWEKGGVLEDFAVFLFSRFQDVRVSKNKRPGDNETDIEAILSEKVRPQFMNDYIGPKIVCECKNKKTGSIDVGMVVKLAQLLPLRGSEFGIFISIMGMGGRGWRYGEGKRKKILLKEGLRIISFRVEELKKLRDGANFLTMIKEKVYALYDEVEDDSPGIPNESHVEYVKHMLEIINHFNKCGFLDEEEKATLHTKVISKYGSVEEPKKRRKKSS
ncbi:hypothetical protein AM501_03445 [Aneurinibacillus migulanus]|uniref:restriction endonuclease n=1 Tax=Aneurinibacillus migulanus TaxID=47500 RepID=UPI0005BA562A|nr:restriction endonuclease [Aneurinibacillus migulanus]KIV55076.1 hypothetical protein TS64_12440 [Aneurinibacillus migulanus]KPD09579.1 hypothetical protein AM501_03445 [Aneurinibacillus migulanus]